jgi:hypothetical protein
MRVEVMSTTVSPRLQASAVMTLVAASLGRDHRAPDFRPARVQDANRDVLRHRGEDGAGMQHLRAEIRQLRRLGKRELRDEHRIGDDPRVGGQHPVHVGPDLNFFDVQARAEDRRRIVRSAPPERCRHAGGGRADESAQHRHFAGGGPRRDQFLRPAACGIGVGDGHRVFRVGHEHPARIDPRSGNTLRHERRGAHPAACQFAHRQDRVGGNRRDFPLRRPSAHSL